MWWKACVGGRSRGHFRGVWRGGLREGRGVEALLDVVRPEGGKERSGRKPCPQASDPSQTGSQPPRGQAPLRRPLQGLRGQAQQSLVPCCAPRLEQKPSTLAAIPTPMTHVLRDIGQAQVWVAPDAAAQVRLELPRHDLAGSKRFWTGGRGLFWVGQMPRSGASHPKLAFLSPRALNPE